MAILQKNWIDNFTRVPNTVINDTQLSLKALGLFTYMASKPDNWQFSLNGMCSQLSESRPTILRILEELNIMGYLQKTKTREGKYNGVNTYKLFETSQTPSESRNVTHKMLLTKCDSQNFTTSNTNTNNTKKSNTNTSPRAQDLQSSFKSKKQLLSLSDEVNDYRQKLIASKYVGSCVKDVYVEQIPTDIFIDAKGHLSTTTKSSKQLLPSTLNEMWTLLYDYNESKKRGDASAFKREAS